MSLKQLKDIGYKSVTPNNSLSLLHPSFFSPTNVETFQSMEYCRGEEILVCLASLTINVVQPGLAKLDLRAGTIIHIMTFLWKMLPYP